MLPNQGFHSIDKRIGNQLDFQSFILFLFNLFDGSRIKRMPKTN